MVEKNKMTKNVLLIVSALLFFCMMTKEGFELSTSTTCGTPGGDGKCTKGCKLIPASPRCELDTTPQCSGINVTVEGELGCTAGDLTPLIGCYTEQEEDGVVGKFYKNEDGYQLHNYNQDDIQQRWGIHEPGATVPDDSKSTGEDSWSGKYEALAFVVSSDEIPPERGWSVKCGDNEADVFTGRPFLFTPSSDPDLSITEDDCNKKLTDPPPSDGADLNELCELTESKGPTGCKFTPSGTGSCVNETFTVDYDCKVGGGDKENPCKCHGCGWWGGKYGGGSGPAVDLLGSHGSSEGISFPGSGDKVNCGCYESDDGEKDGKNIGCDNVPMFAGSEAGVWGRGGLLPPTCPPQDKVNEFIIGNQGGNRKTWDELRPNFGDKDSIGWTDPRWAWSLTVIIIIIIFILWLIFGRN